MTFLFFRHFLALDILLIINVFHLTTAMSHFPKPKKFFAPEKFIMQVIDQVGIIYATLILRGAELRLGGRGGFLLKIYLVKFWEFLAIHFSLFTVAPHKKSASAHPARINYYELITKN